jgi:group I intron endonuclease
MAYIYRIVNDINNKSYIGKTTLSSINKRFQQHLKESSYRRSENRPLYRAINKYGKEHFYIELVEECPLELLSEREIY